MSNYDVFISYSRKDDADGFVTRMKAALQKDGLRVWMDDKIVSSAEWWAQIEAHIERSNNFLLFISEQSLSSEWCQKEIAHAFALGKRLIPFQLSAIDERRVRGGWLDTSWEQIARRNWELLLRVQWITSYLELPDFDAAAARVSADAQTDPQYVEAHTRLLQQVQTWRTSGESPGAYIGGAPLAAAEAWLAAWDALPARDRTQPVPTDDQRAFVSACRAAQDEAERLKAEQEARTRELVAQTQRAAEENARLGRRTARFRLAAAIAGLVGILALGATIIAAGQTGEARTAEAQANAALTAVPPTLTLVNRQAEEAVALAASATRAVATAAQQLFEMQASATQIPPTLTQAAVIQDISLSFANLLLQNGENPSAQLAGMDAVVEQYPEQAAAYLVRGVMYAVQGEHERALEDYDEAIRLDPEVADAYYNRGNARHDVGDLEGAIADYTQAIRLYPGYTEAYYNRGIARQDLGDQRGALEDYDETIRLDPDYTQAYYSRGNAKSALGDPAGAIDDYNQAIRLDPDYALAYNNRGIARYDIGDFQGAIEDYDEAIRLDPGNADAFSNRGNARQRQGDLEGAIVDYDQAIGLRPNFAAAYSNRAFAHYRAAQTSATRRAHLEQALADWQTAGSLGGNLAPAARDAMAEIEAELGGTPAPTPRF